MVHVLFRATLDGLIVRGPMIGREHAFALVADWLGERPKIDRDRALAELARRYLAGHGPADDRDLAKWAQLPLRDVACRPEGDRVRSSTHRPDGLVDLPRDEARHRSRRRACWDRSTRCCSAGAPEDSCSTARRRS